MRSTVLTNLFAQDLATAEAEGRVQYAEDLKIVRDDNGKLPTVKIWRGKAKKPYANWRFSTADKREETIAREIGYARERLAEREAWKARKKEMREEMLGKIDVGTLLHYSWGYEQTNSEYYQVVARKGATVTLRRIAAKTVPGSEGFMSSDVSPDRDNFIGKPFDKRIGPYGISMDFGSATPVSDSDKSYSSWYA